MHSIATQTSEKLKPLPDTKDLAFGRNFSDHWFSARYSKSKGWHSAQVAPYGAIPLDPAASVLHYGQALFEGMKAFAQKDGGIALFRPEFNVERMKEGAERLCLQPPPADLFLQGLKKLIEVDARWVPKAEHCALYIRPTLIGTEAFLGVRPSDEVLFFIILSPVGAYFTTRGTLKIWIEDQALRAAPGGLGATKAGANYAASLQAALRAKEKGFDQVLWLDVERSGVEEVGTMNVFFVLKDEIVTPALTGSILPGGMRDSVIQMLRHEGAKVSERRITVNEILERHKKGELLEAFGTGTAAVISPIGEIGLKDNVCRIGNGQVGPLGRRLYDTISAIQHGTKPDTFGWMKKLEDL
jgi:branched-chain amino acid aminotransferase